MAEKKKQSPSFEQIMQMGEQRSIRSAVAMYTIKDLVVAGKINLKSDDMSSFYDLVQQCYDQLREISAGEATMKQKQVLADLLRTSTIDHDEREIMQNEILSPLFTWKDFKEMLVTLKSNQLHESENAGKADPHKLNKELEDKGK